MNLESLSPDFVANVVSFFPNGRRWLADLPLCLAALAEQWRLRDLRPVTPLSFNFVAHAAQVGGGEVVLKVSPDPSVVATETTWLRHHSGKGVVRVLAVSDEAYLMECLSPGLPLKPASLAEDRDAARTIASLIDRLSRNPPPIDVGEVFRPVAEDAGGLDEYGRIFGAQGAVGTDLVDAARAVWSDLVASPSPLCLVHGDFHHGNVLTASRGDGALLPVAIDPHGLVAETEYECAAMLRNQLGWCRDESALVGAVSDRVSILAETLALDSRRIAGWGFAQTVLAACWEALATSDVKDATVLMAARALRRQFERIGRDASDRRRPKAAGVNSAGGPSRTGVQRKADRSGD